MKLHDLQPPKGTRKSRKRLGRGPGSGQGTYAGRGRKGQASRAGGTKGPYFEGGQLPLVRRLPFKRGFTNIFRVEFQVVNLDDLEARFEAGSSVNASLLVGAGLIKHSDRPVKVLGRGELSKSLIVKVDKVSLAAREKIEQAGGSVEEIMAE